MSTVISVENLSKQYRLGQVGTGTLSDDLTRLWYRLRGKEDPFLKIGQTNDRTKKADTPDPDQKSGFFSRSSLLAPRSPLDLVWALKDINFEVNEGEVLGIIGRNGAGKSTLLKILARVTTPTTGEVKVKGRIASLLEVGTGFHPDLSGRENIYLNGAILGMRKHEITRKLDEIIDFSGCERYIDTPVKRYSSGMYVRLAFAVAAHLEPEILIVDEVLAVGDAEFQHKCLGKMQDVAAGGRTVLFVSHNMQALQQLCTRAIVIRHGVALASGSVPDMISLHLGDATTTSSLNGIKDLSDANIRRTGSGEARITTIQVQELLDEPAVRTGTSVRVQVWIAAQTDIDRIAVVLSLTNQLGVRVFHANTRDSRMRLPKMSAGQTRKFVCTIEDVNLIPGTYYFDVAIQAPPSREPLDQVSSAAQVTLSERKSEAWSDANKHGIVYFPQTWTFSEPNEAELVKLSTQN